MATWRPENSMLTQRGVEILNKLKAGVGSITVTRIVAGSGRVAESLLYQQTSISGVQKPMTISAKNTTDVGSEIAFYIENKGFAEPYNLHQIGIYVTHPDYVGEQLYHISQCDANDYDTIPAISYTPVTQGYSVFMEHGNSSSVNITVDPSGMINTVQFNEFKESTKGIIQQIKTDVVGLQDKTEYLSNDNLLINWDFGNPIDQRGGYVVPPGERYGPGDGSYDGQISGYATVNAWHPLNNRIPGAIVNGKQVWFDAGVAVRGYTGNVYCIDRWILAGSSCILVDDGLLITTTDRGQIFRQLFPQEMQTALSGKTVTFSVLATIKSGEFYLTDTSGFSASHADVKMQTGITSWTFPVANFSSIAGLGWWGNSSGNQILVHAAKLELGSQQTLAHQDADGNWVLNEVNFQHPTTKKGTIKLSTNWSGDSSPYTQTVTIPGTTVNSRVDLQPDATAIAQMAEDGTVALYIANNNGVLTANAVGEKPTAEMTIQATITEVI